MKLLLRILTFLPLGFLPAPPVHPDVVSPPAILFDFDSGIGYVVTGVLVLLVAFILWRLLRKKDE